ncbi:MAG: tyrosine-type recombinase/integrase [Bacteroidales bacterium]|jgi:integrase/recombinase XerD
MKQETLYLKIEAFTEYLILKRYSSKSIGSITSTVKRFLTWLENEGIEPEQTIYNDIMAYISYCKSKNNKQRSIQQTIIKINHYYKHLVIDGVLEENPASNIEIKGIKRRILHDILTNEELEQVYRSYKTETQAKEKNKMPPQTMQNIAKRRNKLILGLLIYQGLRTEEIAQLEIQDLKLREGKIFITGSRRTEERTLKLESHQIIDLLDYSNTTRKEILEIKQTPCTKLFPNLGSSENFSNIMQKLMKTLRSENPKVKDAKQLRASVIVNWLKTHNLRKTQHMAGHRYVSSTEVYQLSNLDDLTEEITKYHPII